MPILVDSNILLDIFTVDQHWYEWSANILAESAEKSLLFINPIIYSEISIGFERIEDLENALPCNYIQRAELPYEAAFLAGKCFLKYRKAGGSKLSPLPDFYIGAHAAIKGWSILTRDKGRYQSYFPSLHVIAP
jgi:predicted nucleic acid-binding protein